MSGTENRFSGRFSYFTGGEYNAREVDLKHDEATQSYQLAAASTLAQSKNLAVLLTTCEEALQAINKLQLASGEKMVALMPAPTESIKKSPAKSAGYVKLCVEFLTAGLLHYMENGYDLSKELRVCQKQLQLRSEISYDFEPMGELEELDPGSEVWDAPVSQSRVGMEEDDDASEDETQAVKPLPVGTAVPSPKLNGTKKVSHRAMKK
jgi:hypothetical protein